MAGLHRFLFHSAIAFTLILGLCAASSISLAQQLSVPPRGVPYNQYCASCHGSDGKGDGPLAKMLVTKPTDLTLLAKENKGTFPALKVQRAIDGRDPVTGHGDTDMPVWGQRFKVESMSGNPRETGVRCRVCEIVGYISSMQEK